MADIDSEDDDENDLQDIDSEDNDENDLQDIDSEDNDKKDLFDARLFRLLFSVEIEASLSIYVSRIYLTQSNEHSTISASIQHA